MSQCQSKCTGVCCVQQMMMEKKTKLMNDVHQVTTQIKQDEISSNVPGGRIMDRLIPPPSEQEIICHIFISKLTETQVHLTQQEHHLHTSASHSRLHFPTKVFAQVSLASPVTLYYHEVKGAYNENKYETWQLRALTQPKLI